MCPTAIQLCNSEMGIDNNSFPTECSSCDVAYEERTLYRKAIIVPAVEEKKGPDRVHRDYVSKNTILFRGL